MLLSQRIRRLVFVSIVSACHYGTLSTAHAASVSTTEADTDTIRSVTLAQAIENALSQNPGLKSLEASIRTAAARQQQAGVRPNPELEVEVEDIGLSGSASSMGEAVYSVRAAQTLELGGKRAQRQHTASLRKDLAQWDLASQRLDLVAQVRTRFIDLLVLQERVRIVTGSYELGQRVQAIAAERVVHGKVSPLELMKADVQLAGQRIELHRVKRTLAAARIALAALWSAAPDEADTLRAAGDLRDVQGLPDSAALDKALSSNPDMARWHTEATLADALTAEERARRAPDVTVAAGLVHPRGTGNAFLKFSISLPLPLFDRNQGNIGAALAEADRTQYAQRAAENAIRSEFAAKWQELQAISEEAKSMETEILPAARKAFEAAQQGYQSGKLEYLDVLDAQQTLAKAEMQQLETLSALQQTAVQLDRLSGAGVTQ